MAGRGAYSRRPRRNWRPNDRQREVLDLLVEGKTNADIAEQVGLSVDGVKWHVSQLLGESGLEDRQALARWWAEERTRRRSPVIVALNENSRPLWPTAALTSVVALLAFLVLFVSYSSHDSGQKYAAGPLNVDLNSTPWPAESLLALAQSEAAPSSCGPPDLQDLRLVTAGELQAQGLVSVGRVAISGHCPIYVSNRADRAVVWLGGGGYIRLDAIPPPVWRSGTPLWSDPQVSACCVRIPFGVGGATYTLNAYGSAPGVSGTLEAFGRVEAVNAVKIEPTTRAGTYLSVTVAAGESCCGNGPARRVAMTSDGEVFVDPGSPTGDLAWNARTGEAIDLRSLTPAGRLSVETESGDIGVAETECEPPQLVCVVHSSAATHELIAPVAGWVSCVTEQRETEFNGRQAFVLHSYLELDAGNFRLRVDALRHASLTPVLDWACEPYFVASGDAIADVANVGEIVAFAPDGSQLSIVSTPDGRLFIGDAGLRFGCPCEPQP